MDNGHLDQDGGELVDAEPAPRTSVEKVGELAGLIGELVPESEESARAVQLLQALWPRVVNFLPQDPDQLDAILITLARHALLARSDLAPGPTTLEELVAGEVHVLPEPADVEYPAEDVEP